MGGTERMNLAQRTGLAWLIVGAVGFYTIIMAEPIAIGFAIVHLVMIAVGLVILRKGEGEE
jgi:hypothetical protein